MLFLQLASSRLINDMQIYHKIGKNIRTVNNVQIYNTKLKRILEQSANKQNYDLEQTKPRLTQ